MKTLTPIFGLLIALGFFVVAVGGEGLPSFVRIIAAMAGLIVFLLLKQRLEQ